MCIYIHTYIYIYGHAPLIFSISHNCGGGYHIQSAWGNQWSGLIFDTGGTGLIMFRLIVPHIFSKPKSPAYPHACIPHAVRNVGF